MDLFYLIVVVRVTLEIEFVYLIRYGSRQTRGAAASLANSVFARHSLSPSPTDSLTPFLSLFLTGLRLSAGNIALRFDFKDRNLDSMSTWSRPNDDDSGNGGRKSQARYSLLRGERVSSGTCLSVLEAKTAVGRGR